jgi:hypothetical protein
MKTVKRLRIISAIECNSYASSVPRTMCCYRVFCSAASAQFMSVA